MSHLENFSDDCRKIRQTSPVVHNITNYVAMNLSANVLLAIGASPLMSAEPSEMEDIAAAADTLVINTGCLDTVQIEAMRLAAAAMSRLGKPWVLDPVGAGLSRLRTETARELIERWRPAVIRGNVAEILALSGLDAARRGIDSAEGNPPVTGYARLLAAKTGSVVSVSGAVDYITDGSDVVEIANGTPLMASVTAMGCVSSAVTAAFLAVDADPLAAAAGAMALMGISGERAAAASSGPGSFAVKFIDVISGAAPEESEIRYGQGQA